MCPYNTATQPLLYYYQHKHSDCPIPSSVQAGKIGELADSYALITCQNQRHTTIEASTFFAAPDVSILRAVF